jgi:hypothetical protein
MPTLDDAINAIRAGNREEGRQILEEVLETDESNEDVWLWLSSVVDTDEDREICLENVLALNPDNVVAQKGLEALRSGTFNVHDMVREVAGEEEEEALPEATFLDEFAMAGEDEEDIEFPSTMKPRKKARIGAGLNIRMIVLIFVALCVVLSLGGVAAYNLFSGGDGEPEAGQETPAEVEQPEAVPTETPIPTPTSTPTVTLTPFLLPTSEPTKLPSPTATPVVSPTAPG